MPWCCEITDLNKFISEAKPNDKFIYYTGCSVQDTLLSKEIGKIVYEYAISGLVYLAQRRSIGYYFDFDHFLIKASLTPVYLLVPFADDKTEQLRKQRGVRNYGGNERTNKVRVELDNSVRSRDGLLTGSLQDFRY